MTEKHHCYMPRGVHQFLLRERNLTDISGTKAGAWALVHRDIAAPKTDPKPCRRLTIKELR